MANTVCLCSAIALNAVLAGITVETRSWLALVGQGASLALLGYIAWKVRTRRKPVCRKKDD